MTREPDRVATLLAALAPIRDDDLVVETHSPGARALLEAILETPCRPGAVERRSPDRRRSVKMLALAAALLAAALLSLPAFGVGAKLASLFAGWRDPRAPVPTAPDVVVASGKAGVRWRIVATSSDQGLCLGLFNRAGGDSLGSASCGYTDIRGRLPGDLRGDPASSCVATPSALAPCGSLPLHWIDIGGGGNTVGLERHFAFGALSTEVAQVELVLTDGRTMDARVVEEPGGLPLDFYWASWSCPVQPVTEGPYGGLGLHECREDGGAAVSMAVAFDGEGRALERRVPAWNGNPTGDPDGPRPPVGQPAED